MNKITNKNKSKIIRKLKKEDNNPTKPNRTKWVRYNGLNTTTPDQEINHPRGSAKQAADSKWAISLKNELNNQQRIRK